MFYHVSAPWVNHLLRKYDCGLKSLSKSLIGQAMVDPLLGFRVWGAGIVLGTSLGVGRGAYASLSPL